MALFEEKIAQLESIRQESVVRLKPDQLIYFNSLEPWWNQGTTIQEAPKNLGAAIAVIWWQACNFIDNYFDLNADSISPEQNDDVFRELFLSINITDKSLSRTVPAQTVYDILTTYIQTEPDAERKVRLENNLTTFMNTSIHGFKDVLTMRKKKYLLHEAMELKARMTIPLITLWFHLTEPVHDETSFSRLAESMKLAFDDFMTDDRQDFEHDRKSGDINLVIGLFNDNCRQKMDEDEAEFDALMHDYWEEMGPYLNHLLTELRHT